MSKIVFDASALLALLHQEPGHEIAQKYLPHAIMSTVNISETASVLLDIGISENTAKKMLAEIIKEIIPFDDHQAFLAASLKPLTKPYGLSFGDRACLSLAILKQLPVLTADKIWTKIHPCSIKILLIR